MKAHEFEGSCGISLFEPKAFQARQLAKILAVGLTRCRKLPVHRPRGSEDQVVERRIVGRSGCRIDASIDADGCYVADMSVKGARIVLPRATEMPDSFSLCLPWRDDNPVRKRWQDEFHVGVEFELVSAIDARTLVKIVQQLAELKRLNLILPDQLKRAESLAYAA